MDYFVDKLLEHLLHVPSFWRSSSLNPLLMRAFVWVDNNNAAQLKQRLSSILATEFELLKWEHWNDFYHEQDTLNSTYNGLWAEIKPQLAEPDDGHCEGGLVAEVESSEHMPFKQSPGNFQLLIVVSIAYSHLALQPLTDMEEGGLRRS